MSVPAMIGHLLLEYFSRRPLPRVPEAAAIMAAPDQITAFMESGRGEGMLAHLYFLHAVMSLPVIRPGDTVLDLACGPANQLARIAQINPQSQFIGIDASPGMLELARKTLDDSANVKLQLGDLTQLHSIASASIDCAICTMSLHHLPDIAALEQAVREIRRMLKPEGGVYMADFGRLKRVATQRHFAFDRADSQSPQFTDDFLQSMRAAFSADELRNAVAALNMPVTAYATALAPFLVIFRSEARRPIDGALAAQVAKYYRELSHQQRRDFDNLARWFRFNGVSLPCTVSTTGEESELCSANPRKITPESPASGADPSFGGATDWDANA